ncbi:hypothetical protein ABPG72_004084 [Tetrahymena utriculariae]
MSLMWWTLLHVICGNNLLLLVSTKILSSLQVASYKNVEIFCRQIELQQIQQITKSYFMKAGCLEVLEENLNKKKFNSFSVLSKIYFAIQQLSDREDFQCAHRYFFESKVQTKYNMLISQNKKFNILTINSDFLLIDSIFDTQQMLEESNKQIGQIAQKLLIQEKIGKKDGSLFLNQKFFYKVQIEIKKLLNELQSIVQNLNWKTHPLKKNTLQIKKC